MDAIFKFMVLRPPQAVDTAAKSAIDLTDSASNLQSDLKEATHSDNAYKEMESEAQAYIDSAAYLSDTSEFQTPLADLAAFLTNAKDLDEQGVKDATNRLMGANAATVVADEDFQADRQRLSDSLIAASVSGVEADYETLLQTIRTAELVERIAGNDPDLDDPAAIAAALGETVILPDELFPLPPVKEEVRVSPRSAAPVATTADDVQTTISADAVGRTLNELLDSRNLIFQTPEIAEQLDETTDIPFEKPSAEIMPSSWLMAAETTSTLTPETYAVLTSFNIDLATTPLPVVTEILETKMAQMVEMVQPPVKVFGWGDTYMPFPDLTGVVQAQDDSVTIDKGSYRTLGILDLDVVQKVLQKYELGEVAHIENVLEGESKLRTHRKLKRTEETYTVETETTEETEKDLQSAERFELEKESQEVIKQENNQAHDFSADVTVKYGGVVDVTANTKYGYKSSSKTAKEQSNSSALSYAREVSERTVSRIKDRVRKEQVRKVIQEVEETNEHEIDNEEGTGHVVGVYRYVDKTYKAQIFNYGKRLMMEFIIPEPSAFTLYALKNATPEGVTLEKPRPPVNKQGNPLTVDDIKPETYKQWVAQYNVKKVNPPPKALITKSFTYVSDTVADAQDTKKSFSAQVKLVTIADGYAAQKAFYSMTYATLGANPDHTASVHGMELVILFIGTGYSNLSGSWGFMRQGWLTLGDEAGDLPVHVSTTHKTKVSVSGEVLCKCTERARENWRLETFSAIMTAYENLKSRYDEQLAAALVSGGVGISGRSAKVNRAFEKRELKKGAITLLLQKNVPHLTHIGSVKTIKKDVAKDYWGYPEIDFSDAQIEAPIIQFFEQAFEWQHMMYTFYPYFWAGRQKWPQLQQIEDKDPLFAKFLQAGAARVQVPVRTGYEEDMNLFFLGIFPWKASGMNNVSSGKYLPLIKEIMEKQGIYHMKYGGTVDVTQNSMTVSGSGTDFSKKDDVDREIDIRGVKYRIASVASKTELKLGEVYRGDTQSGVQYFIGDKRIGPPWYIKVPTSLVYLQQDGKLPDFTKV